MNRTSGLVLAVTVLIACERGVGRMRTHSTSKGSERHPHSHGNAAGQCRHVAMKKGLASDACAT